MNGPRMCLNVFKRNYVLRENELSKLKKNVKNLCQILNKPCVYVTLIRKSLWSPSFIYVINDNFQVLCNFQTKSIKRVCSSWHHRPMEFGCHTVKVNIMYNILNCTVFE